MEGGRTAITRAQIAFNQIQDSHTVNQYLSYLWDLAQNLVDLPCIEQLCELGAVGIIGNLLEEKSAQIRKYALQILAQFSLSLFGLTDIIKLDIGEKVIQLLYDSDNVATAASYCLLKISSSYAGVNYLVIKKVQKILVKLALSSASASNLILVKTCVKVLVQIFTLSTKVRVPRTKYFLLLVERYSKDPDILSALSELLDLWGVDVDVPLSRNMEMRIEELALLKEEMTEENLEICTTATTSVLESIDKHPYLLLEFIGNGGTDIVLFNIQNTSSDEPLTRLSFALLCNIVDTKKGQKAIMDLEAIAFAIDTLKDVQKKNINSLFTFYLVRFLEICCQHSETLECVLLNNGLEVLVEFTTSILSTSLNVLCIPCFSAFTTIMLNYKSKARPYLGAFEPLKLLFRQAGVMSQLQDNTQLVKNFVQFMSLYAPRMIERQNDGFRVKRKPSRLMQVTHSVKNFSSN
eukprot:TRINITY_DN64_c0_g1_i1.p1 TRINITY_DN64_c0_g1~~TRINITY_DN64_c0_g1_i1.p1  ORF type:complete len:464 (+),score=59.92 TRINITY_DN64_c0_g1_i1:89-1480(+)